MEHKNAHNHIVGYGTYIFVWLTLVTLTALTVTAASFDLGNFSIAVSYTHLTLPTTERV